MTEFLLGGIAACGAGLFTNPLEVVKTRMQLQGELKARGQYAVHYKHVFHAFYTIGKMDGILALQKGLVPALWYQFFMNGFRLGAYQWIVNSGFTRDTDGSISFLRSIGAGATAGCMGAFVGSPVYMVKTQLQARSVQAIAVGHQHPHSNMSSAVREIYREYGVKGLWRGVTGAMARVMVGSAAQLSTFSKTNELITAKKWFPEGHLMNAFTASMLSGVVVVCFMTPFDVISTRLYNQGVTASGKGVYYNGLIDCFTKILKNEGVWGFYKGWAPQFFRLGPHTVLSLMFWTQTRKAYHGMQDKLAAEKSVEM